MAAVLTTACASREPKPEAEANAVKAAPARSAPAKAATVKPAPRKESATTSETAGEAGTASGTATAGKFARLKLGMTFKQVQTLIGRPDRQWQHATDKASIPFYFGPDRWIIQCAYKGEGVLTFNAGGEQLLTRIEVNAAQ